MAGLILPRRFTSQPQGAVEIDWGNPLTRGLKVVHNFRGLSFRLNQVTNGRFSLVGSGFGGGSEGLEFLANASYITTPLNTTDFTNSATIIGVLKNKNSTPTEGQTGFPWNVNSNSLGTHYPHTNNTIYYSSFRGASRFYFLPSVSIPYTEKHVLAETVNGSTPSSSVYVNGNLVNMYGGAFTFSPVTPMRIGYNDQATPYVGTIYAIFVWNRELSANEIANFSRNPWQIFRAPKRTLYFDVSTPGIPTLSLPGVDQITTTGARPYVSLGF